MSFVKQQQTGNYSDSLHSGLTLRRVALAEAITLLLLMFVAMPLKYYAGVGNATSIMGPIHGAVFLLFVYIVVRSLAEGLIGWVAVVLLLIGAMIPFGGILNERWLLRKLNSAAT